MSQFETMNELFLDFSNEFQQVKQALDRKNLSKPIINRQVVAKVVDQEKNAVKVTKLIPLKNTSSQTAPNLHSIEIQTDPSKYSVEQLCLKLDEYQNLLDLREIELNEIKQDRQSGLKHQINFHASDATLKLNQQLLDTQINLDNSYIKARTLQDALDQMTVKYNLCVDDYNDMGEEYERLADQYSKLHHDYQMLTAKYKNINYEKQDLETRLKESKDNKRIDTLEVQESYNLLQSEKDKNKALLIQLENSEMLVKRLRDKLADTHNVTFDPESSKFISIINQQQSMIDDLGKTLKSNHLILQEIAKNPEDEEFTPIKRAPPPLLQSPENNSPFEYTPDSQNTDQLRQQWLDTKRELASIEVEGVQNALQQLEFHQKELSKLMKK